MTKIKQKRNKFFAAIFALLGVSFVGLFAVVTPEWNVRADPHNGNVSSEEEKNNFNTSRYESVPHMQTPEPLYAIYMSQCVAGTPSFRDKLVALIEGTTLNAVVIDVKDYSGTIGFPAKDPRFEEASLAECGASDMEAFIKTLHDKGIYAIARITVFQDPFYTEKFPDQAVQSVSRPGEPWEDYKGLAFVDVSSRDFWDYIAILSKEAYAIGFDELNYDYIRYPSDGPMKDAQYVNDNKAEALEQFFKYLHEEVKGTNPSTGPGQAGAKMSADLFGYTTVLSDDLGIGQQLERALPYFDYVAPMVYPSHYNKGFAGLTNPNNDPYKVVYTSMAEAVRRALSGEGRVETLDGKPLFKDEIIPATADQATTTKKVATGFYTKPVHDKLKLRPWLQDFDYGKDYTVADIEAQIKATYDAGLTSWFFWDPANKYENLKQYLATSSQSSD